MIEPPTTRGSDVLAAARAAGFDVLAGVPCSYLTPLINAALGGVGYLSATNEGEAVAIAAGAWLAGKRPLVMMQNSGLGNAVSPLTSLVAPCKIGVGLIVTWRGEPGGAPDEPQHALMGAITPQLLSLIGVAHEPFSLAAIARAAETTAAGRPAALILSKGVVADEPLRATTAATRTPGRIVDRRERGELPTRVAALETILAAAPPHAAIVSTTGKCSRELFTIGDRDACFYLVGAMGCASAVGLGIALHVDRPTVIVDGDGALSMRLETLATIGSAAPPQLTHVVLDNGVHDSTGGQPTAAPHTEFAALAAACCYPIAHQVDSLAGLAHALADTTPGPRMIHARIVPGSLAKLGRPTLGPADVAARFRAFLASARS